MEESYSLRKAGHNDYEFVFEVKKNALGEYITETWGWDEELQCKMHEDDIRTQNLFIIEAEGKGIGTLSINEEGNRIVIGSLYILDKYQSKGIGSRIVKNIISENPGKEIRLGVLKVNFRAKKLYERLGFEVTGEENHHHKMIYKKNDKV